MAARAVGGQLQCTFVNCAKINKDAFDDGTFGIGPTGSEGAGVNVVEECVVPFQFCYNNPCCPSCEEPPSGDEISYRRFKDCETDSNQNIWISLQDEATAAPYDVALYNGNCYYISPENEIRSENILPSGAIILNPAAVGYTSCLACTGGNCDRCYLVTFTITQFTSGTFTTTFGTETSTILTCRGDQPIFQSPCSFCFNDPDMYCLEIYNDFTTTGDGCTTVSFRFAANNYAVYSTRCNGQIVGVYPDIIQEMAQTNGPYWVTVTDIIVEPVEECVGCQTATCLTCPSSIALTVTNGGGNIPNGTYVLNRNGSSCDWIYGTFPIFGELGILLRCNGSDDCGGGRRWELSISTDSFFGDYGYGEEPNQTGCPPTGEFNVYSSNPPNIQVTIED